jgi:anti-anti-sigma regulatory factor
VTPSVSESRRKASPAKESSAVNKADADDEDPFSLDFTKICVDDEPAPASVSVPAATPASAPVVEPTPPLELVSAAPAAQPEAPPEPAPSAFESFKSPLELVDFSAVTIEDVPPVVAVAAPVAVKAEEPKPEEPKVEAAKSSVAKKAPQQPSVLLDIARQHAAGKTVEASTALEAALRTATLGKATEQGWGMLFDLLQILNRRQAFENLADAYAKRFEKSAPAWLDASGEADSSLDTGGAAYVALSGILSASSEGALKKLVEIAGSNPTVRLGLLKVTDAGNDGCRLLLESLRAIKKCGRECLLTGADEFAAMLANKVEMMKREREETWLLLLELYQRAGNQVAFEDTAVAYAVTFEVSPPSWEAAAPSKAAPKSAAKSKDPFMLEGELLAGMNSIATLAAAAKGKDAITIETDHLARIDEVSAKILLDTLTPLHAQGLHIRIRGANLLVATLLAGCGLDKIATIETRRR